MEHTQYDYLANLMKLGCMYNADDFHVFISLSGHVDQVELSVYCGGWAADKRPDLIKSFHIEFERTYQEIAAREALLTLTRLHRLYRKNGVTDISKLT